MGLCLLSTSIFTDVFITPNNLTNCIFFFISAICLKIEPRSRKSDILSLSILKFELSEIFFKKKILN